MKFDRLKLEDPICKEDYGDYAEMNKHFIEWRNYILPDYQDGPENYAAKDLIVNWPLYDSHDHDESDFYVFSGYMKPGTHSLIIYDPVTDQLLKKENIYILPRSGELKNPK